MKNLNEIVDLSKYPINKTDSSEYKDLIEYNRILLDKDGCCVLPKFIKAESLIFMKNEVERNLGKIFWTNDKHNPYFSKDDETLHKDHPKRIFSLRQSGYVNSDDLEEN